MHSVEEREVKADEDAPRGHGARITISGARTCIARKTEGPGVCLKNLKERVSSLNEASPRPHVGNYACRWQPSPDGRASVVWLSLVVWLWLGRVVKLAPATSYITIFGRATVANFMIYSVPRYWLQTLAAPKWGNPNLETARTQRPRIRRE